MTKMVKAQRWPAGGRIKEVVWNDHARGQGWAKPAGYDAEPLCLCRTIGYLLNEDEHVVRMVQNQDSDTGNIDGVQIIGKRMILSRRVLRRR